MATLTQLELNLRPAEEVEREIRALVLRILETPAQPSGRELVNKIEGALGIKARWDLPATLAAMRDDAKLPGAHREFLDSLIDSGDLHRALNGEGAPEREIASSLDLLIHSSRAYRNSKGFSELIEFMTRFKQYAPFNNLLVWSQNPACSYYATEKDWRERFGRELKEDPRPMVILAPKHPVMLVYDLDQTVGPPLPDELDRFAKFEGEFDEESLARTVENAAQHDRIRVDFKTLSSTNAGFATFARGTAEWKMRIVIHDQLDTSSRFGVLCHELAHIFLGHLGADRDRWWPARSNLDRHSIEIEAEATAYVVTNRLGLFGASAAYISRHLKEDEIPAGVSPEYIAKAAGRIEEMTRTRLPARQPKPATLAKRRR